MEVVFLPSTFHKIEQTESFRIRTVFNAGQSAVSASLNNDNHLFELNEITLGSEQTFSVPLESGSMSLILPLVGELKIEQGNYISELEPGQVLVVKAENDILLKFKNSSAEGPSLFLQLKYKNESNQEISKVQSLDIDQLNQQLNSIEISPECTLSLGKFLGRFDYSFDIKKNEQIVAYVISGVFELEHRLMEAGDMMMLSGMDTNQIEFESLSVESILLILKFKK
jgi:quercetin 2,3-dioxygenase